MKCTYCEMNREESELREDGYCKDAAKCYLDDWFRRTH